MSKTRERELGEDVRRLTEEEQEDHAQDQVAARVQGGDESMSQDRTKRSQIDFQDEGVTVGRVEAQKSILDTSGTSEGLSKSIQALLSAPRGKKKILRPRPDGVGSASKQIRKFCLECVGGSSELVRTCSGYSCPLWAWRFGKDPVSIENGDLLDAEKVREMNSCR